jgi:hypothetical protein
MPRDPDKIERWMALDAVEAAIPAMEATGTSEVARGVQPSKQTAVGFIEAYRFAEGDPETMAELPATKTSTWADRRRQFIVRHLAQMRSSDTHADGFKPDGTPTKRMLGLIAWAYMPPESQKKATAWFKAGCPVKATRKRRNPSRREALLIAQKLPVPQAADAMVRRMARSGVGTLHRIYMRGEAEQVPALARLGYVRVEETHPPGSTDAPWTVYDVRTTRKLHDAVDATQAAREAYRDEFQQVGLFGRRNPGEQGSLFGSLPSAPAAPVREVVPRGTDLFDRFASLGAPAPGEKGYRPPPTMPPGAWDGLNPHDLAGSLVRSAFLNLDQPETRWAWDAAVQGRSEEAEEDGEIVFTLPDLLGVPYRDGEGQPMDSRSRDAIAIEAMRYAMEGSDRVGGVGPIYDVIDPGKSRRGPARSRSGRDETGRLPAWASAAILGDRLASITPGYQNKLRLVNVDKETARKFIEKHHSALPYLNPKGLMYALGAVKGDRLVAVATAGHPTGKWARRGLLDPRNIVELTRVASDGSVKGAASMLVGRLLRIVASSKRGDPDAPSMFVTYQLSSEDGTSYRALADMGLRPVEFRPGSKASGARAGAAEEDRALAQVDKIRWEFSPDPGVALPAQWSLLEKQPVQAGLLGGRRNPSGWDDPRREGSEVQSVIFDAGRWTLGEARAWLRRHAYDGLDPDRTANTLRFRQRDPGSFRRDTFRTIPMGADTGIQAVVAVPR